MARSQDQLLQDMYHRIGAQPGLIGYWRFGEGDGVYTVDHSGNGHEGHLTSYQGEGEPLWVPGVFTEIDTTGSGG